MHSRTRPWCQGGGAQGCVCARAQAAAPGEPAFVKEGDRVKKGQTVGIIEAMKLMNEIEVRW